MASVIHSLVSKTETTAVIRWSADSVVNYLWFSTNNGYSWYGISVADNTTGTYTISGLSANTSYQVKTRVQIKSTQRTVDSTALTVKTFAFPYASSMPNFTIGDQLTIGLYNPLNRSIIVDVIAANSALISSVTTTGTSITGYNSSSIVDAFYASIPNNIDGTYSVKVTYDEHISTLSGGTYRVNVDDCSPVWENLSYWDSNSAVTAITDNSAWIVQNKSTPVYFAQRVYARKSASVSSCYVEVENNIVHLQLVQGATYVYAIGQGLEIDSANDIEAVFNLVDSRGITKRETLTLTMLEYHEPTGICSVRRESNYYAVSYIKADADYSFINGKNEVTITYSGRREDQGSATLSGNLTDGVESTIYADKNYSWIFDITITDSFGESVTYRETLSYGTPILFIDKKRNAVGVNCLPDFYNSFEVNGNLYVNSKAIRPNGAITAYLDRKLQSSEITAGGYTSIPLTSDTTRIVGDDFEMYGSLYVRKKSSATKLLVSASLGLNQIYDSGARHIRIVKYDGNQPNANNTLAWAWARLEYYFPQFLVIPPTVVTVGSNDVYLQFFYYTDYNRDEIGYEGEDTSNPVKGCRTSLTVQALEW